MYDTINIVGLRQPDEVDDPLTSVLRSNVGARIEKSPNWPEYEAGLKERGSLTLWVMREALAAWRVRRRKKRGDQPRYSDLAIETA